ncbi:hypothetical protein ANANG_G00264930 [Anguilla anguilla]|uniref:Cystatin-B n=1 Tax=Anguilla anguilla TaxID=7936 RepID=A0A9D3LPJ0_ANGAN|nr:hypothetical protein ANANG_G00264930 [Anguilla anguilla]
MGHIVGYHCPFTCDPKHCAVSKFSLIIMPLCGGTGAPQDATPEVQKICDEIKSQSEEDAGKKFDDFKAKSFASQVVAGTNYFIKVHVGGDDYVHLCVHRPLPCANQPLKLLRQETGKLHHEPIGYF